MFRIISARRLKDIPAKSPNTLIFSHRTLIPTQTPPIDLVKEADKQAIEAAGEKNYNELAKKGQSPKRQSRTLK